MYKVVYLDEHDNVVAVDDNCESIEIKNNKRDLRLFRNDFEELRIGCNVGRYFIFDNSFEVPDLLTGEMKQSALELSQFEKIETEVIISRQDEYIKLLEQKIKELETPQ